MVYGTIDFWGQEIKSRGQTRPQLDLRPGGSIVLNTIESSSSASSLPGLAYLPVILPTKKKRRQTKIIPRRLSRANNRHNCSRGQWSVRCLFFLDFSLDRLVEKTNKIGNHKRTRTRLELGEMKRNRCRRFTNWLESIRRTHIRRPKRYSDHIKRRKIDISYHHYRLAETVHRIQLQSSRVLFLTGLRRRRHVVMQTIENCESSHLTTLPAIYLYRLLKNGNKIWRRQQRKH